MPAETFAFVLIRKPPKHYLLVQEKQNPSLKGLWGLPGGHVDPGETPAQAAKRETKEEVGLDVEPGPVIIDVKLENQSKRFLVFDGQLLSNHLKVNDRELMTAQWLDIGQVNSLKSNQKLRGQWVTDAIIKAKPLSL